MEDIELINGDMLEELGKMKEKSIDCIITDPPYELNFMNKGWDNAGISFQKETWEKCLRVLKPGGYLLAFGGSRTFHRIAVAIEDAGFEIRDTIMWIYGSVFPKSMNIGIEMDKRNGVESPVVAVGKSGNGETHTRTMQNKLLSGDYSFGGEYEVREAQNKWKGWGTCLKPSFEPIIMARKPFKGSCIDNVIKYGVGGINIDECRVETDELKGKVYNNSGDNLSWGGTYGKGVAYGNELGRFPANTILTYDQITFDEVCGGFPNTKQNGSIKNPNLKNSLGNNGIYKKYLEKKPLWDAYNDSGSAARYFYCAKASKKDRDEGLEEFITVKVNDGRKKEVDNAFQRGSTLRHNTHPTVKPTTLMQYLVRLVSPKGATILDPFMGSGSTGKAIMYENKERNANYKFIGIEQNEEYCKIAKARIEGVNNEKQESSNTD